MELGIELLLGMELGPKSAEITLLTNDPANPAVNLIARWRVVAPFELEPMEVDFGSLRPGAKAERVVVVRRNGSTSLDRLRASSPSKDLTADIEETGNPDAKQLRLTLITDGESISQSSLVDLSTGDGVRPFSLPVRWRIEGPVSVTPPALFTSNVAPGALVKQRVLFRSAADLSKIQMRHVKGANGDDVNDVTIDRVEAGKSGFITVALAWRAPEVIGPARRTLVFEFDNPELGEMQVPWSIIVAKPES
jgi:hypothetical protein